MTSPRAFTSLALLGFLAACGGRPAAAQAVAPAEAATPAFIEVSGSATVAVKPDRVRTSFAVETQGTDADQAATRNAQLMDAVIRAVRGSGVAGVQVETFGYSLRPDYTVTTDRPPQTRVIAGYTALNNVRASATDVAAAGRLIDAAIRAGANRVSALSFEASDTAPARQEVLTQAVRSATAQAETMARALGRSLGVPLEVRGGAEQPYPRAGGGVMFRASEAAVDTPIEAADLTVSASVTIRFALGGALEGR